MTTSGLGRGQRAGSSSVPRSPRRQKTSRNEFRGRRRIAFVAGPFVQIVPQLAEKLTELRQRLLGHAGEHAANVVGVFRQHLLGDSASLRRQLHPDDAAIARIGIAAKQLVALETVDDAGEVAGSHEQQPRQLNEGEAALVGAGELGQHVELRQREVPAAHALSCLAHEQVPARRQAEVDLQGQTGTGERRLAIRSGRQRAGLMIERLVVPA